MRKESEVPKIQVGILSRREVSFTLNSAFYESEGHSLLVGRWKAVRSGINIVLQNDNRELKTESGLVLSPQDSEDSSFTLHSVTIGVDFHWQRREDQVFKGDLKLIIEDEKITAINIISLEEYLKSVISSEMSATSSEELLKAHSVISRGWLLAQSGKRKAFDTGAVKYNPDVRTDDEITRWYDREDHRNFDVCADDHCQRYQGITRLSSPVVDKVIKATSGEVLTYNGTICDTRYYKCCGGITELFENVWEPVIHPYLCRVIDNPALPEGCNLDLTDGLNAEKWILGDPPAFCNTNDKKVLTQVLNDYDQETNDFFRWSIRYSQTDLSGLVKSRTGIEFGIITDIVPLERGVSGRIKRLQINGTSKKMVIGKELEIRKALSKTHLYSSCFFVEKITEGGETWFILHGAGWGHGVGLCQIGAAVMSSKGYNYREILNHYFPGSVLEKQY
jgi:stage II sporulation protein D